MRWIAVCPLLFCACSLLFEPSLATEDAGSDTGDGATLDADPTAPRVFAPELFPDHAGVAGVSAPYLFEGSGYRFADQLLQAPGTHEPVPLVIDGLQPGDVIAITSPGGFFLPWLVCGNELAAGETTLLRDLLAPPCVQDENMAAISVVVPVDVSYDSGEEQTDLVIQTTRGSNEFQTAVPVLPLAEFVGGAPGNDTLYASIHVVETITGMPGGPPMEWTAVADISLFSSVNLNGVNGEPSSRIGCGLTGCAGGSGVAGGEAGGSSNCGASTCGGAGPAAGQGAGTCGGSFGVFNRSAGGGGGGNALDGSPGNNGGGQEGASCTFLSGAAGGTQQVSQELLYILDAKAAGGSGGGAGGTVTESPDFALYGGGGGGGGGSIHIHTPGQLFLNVGGISAIGGGGGSGATGGGNSSKTSGQGGGGSGGAILIQAGDIRGDAPLNVGGGPTLNGGAGGEGFIRLDGRDTSAARLTDALRGPDSDIASPISSDGQWLVRIYSAGGTAFTWGYRSAGDLTYVLEQGTSSGGALTLRPTPDLEPGLHELCVFAVPPSSATAADIEATNKHCVWRAIVPQE